MFRFPLKYFQLKDGTPVFQKSSGFSENIGFWQFCMEMFRFSLQYFQLKDGTRVFQKSFRFSENLFQS